MPSTDHPNADGTHDDAEGPRPFRDAEAWLAEKGVRRDPLIINGPAEQPGDPRAERGASPQQPAPPAPPPIGADTPPGEDADAGGTGPDPSAEDGDIPDRDPSGGHGSARVDDQVSEATAYARRATANTPISEARLRSKMESRGYPPPVVTEAMQRVREQRIVDDKAYAMALVEEGRGKGHAPLRIKTDMQKRDLSDEAIEAALDTIGDRDPEAGAFAVARDRARRYRDVDTETAYRRLVGYLARRGYTEALSRKVAREAVFNDREPQRTSER